MATETNLDPFRLGEDWTITIDCQDSAGEPLDLTGGDLRFRLSDFDQTTLYLDLSKAEGVSIADPATGRAVVLITADMQAGLKAQTFRYDTEAVLGDGTASDQAFGTLPADDSLFSSLP